MADASWSRAGIGRVVMQPLKLKASQQFVLHGNSDIGSTEGRIRHHAEDPATRLSPEFDDEPGSAIGAT